MNYDNHKREPYVVIKKNEVDLCEMTWKVVQDTPVCANAR